MNRPETEPGARKLKNSKCSVSNQILGEGQIWLVKLLYGLIPSRNIPKTYLFMIQVENMLFLQFWVRAFQAFPNSIRWPPNSGILILVYPNMIGKPKKYFNQSRNNHLSLILHPLVKSSTGLWMKNKCLKNNFR